MSLSICIVNWNTSDLLRECLRSIYEHAPTCELEVIVVDNASEDFDISEFQREFPKTIFIRNETNEGYARGNNQAIARTSGSYVLFLNPDTTVGEGALESLMRFMDEHPDAGAAGCKLIRPNGDIDRSCREFPTPMGIAFEYLGLSGAFPRSRLFGRYRMTWFDYDRTIEVDQPMASCLITRREVPDRVGVFDERFPIFCNDVDWCRRVKEAGWKVYFTPDAVVTHHGGASTKQAKRRMIEESHRALARYFEKYYRGPRNLPTRLMVRAGVWLNLRLLHRRGRELRD